MRVMESHSDKSLKVGETLGMKGSKSLLFGNFIDGPGGVPSPSAAATATAGGGNAAAAAAAAARGGGATTASARPYVEFADADKLQAVVEEYLEDFNAVSAKPMSLVLFANAIEHISRISRIINLPYGNALLVGVGGSGRKSLTSLSVFIADYSLFTIEVSKSFGLGEWHEELKKIYRQTGVEGKPTVFMFNDTQIINEVKEREGD